MLKVVGIGGGTGLPALLRGLAAWRSSFGSEGVTVSAIVAVSDNGGSSGRLRQAMGIPAVGDLRNCLVALSEGHPSLKDLFQFRFPSGDGLSGHALGNLIVAALCQLSGSLEQASRTAGEILRLKGVVLPATPVPVTLCAKYENDAVVRGESAISLRGLGIQKAWLEPRHPPPTPGVLQAIAEADALVLGPGSLYTSVIANLLVSGVAEAVRHSPALKIFVCNLMTQPGETDSLSAARHLAALETYLGRGAIDVCLMNDRSLPPALAANYGRHGSEVVRCDRTAIERKGVLLVEADLLSESESKISHDPLKLAHEIVKLVSHRRDAEDAEEIGVCSASSAPLR